MEDRFKFRFFDKKKQKMMYENSDFSDYCKDEWWGHKEQMALEALDVFDNPEHYILMQSTGLKDKNGKLIYEGDIVSIDDEELKGIAQKHDKFDEYYGCIEIKLICKYTTIYKPTVFAESEVIGNIYENADLLRGEERMTTELEKQFFETFGIDPIGCNDNENCTGTLDCRTQCLNAKYPPITNRILLELICIDFNENPYKCRGGASSASVDEIKERILSDFIHEFENNLFRDKEEIKQQVQKLFKEINND